MDKQAEHVPVLGRLTLTDITDAAELFAAPKEDAWGALRKPFSPKMARLSAEMAADGYQLEIRPWRDAGWEDCTFIVEDKIVPLDFDDESRIASIENAWKRRRAKALIHGVNPIYDLMRAIRQLMVTDLGKAMVYTRAAPEGKAIVSVSFIGTTQKYFDWFSNFKFQHDSGMHHGFLELAKRFDAQSATILLPKLAAALGEESFTLADAIIEAKSPQSRVSLWISGHSQGGAIVQTYIHQLMQQGALAQNIQGYTFAAPSVAEAGGSIVPKAYPIYNIVNVDDVVPRIGSQLRLGVDVLFHPNNEFRMRHYRVDDALKEAFGRVELMVQRIQNTDEAICWGIAFMQLLQEMEGDGEFENLFREVFPHASLLKRVKVSTADFADYVISMLTNQLQKLTGQRPDEGLCKSYADTMHTLLLELGPKAMADAMLRCLSGPHRLGADPKDDDFEPPYIAIVKRHLATCDYGIWQQDAPPRCLDAKGRKLLPTRVSGKMLSPTSENLPLPPAQAEATQAPGADSPSGQRQQGGQNDGENT